MADGKARRFERTFKIAALERMATGENVSALSRAPGVRRKLLYQWRETVRRGGIEALRGVGRPRAAARLIARPQLEAPPGVAVPDALSPAQERIAALERKLGQQALELDFFAQALQLSKQAVGRRARRPTRRRPPPDRGLGAAARRVERGADVRAGGCQPGRLLPTVARRGGGRGGIAGSVNW